MVLARLSSFCVVLFALLLASLASAQPRASRRVVVLPFTGPQANESRSALIASLEENGLVVVPLDELDAARARLGLEGRLGDADLAPLGRALGVAAFVEGRVGRTPRSWSLSVRVRSAADGQETGGDSWGGSTAASLGGVRRNGYARLATYVDAARVPTAAELANRTAASGTAASEPEANARSRQATPLASSVPEATSQSDDDGFAASAPEAATVTSPRVEPHDEEPRDTDSTGDTSSRSTRYDAVRVSLLGGSLYRSLDTSVQVYASQRGMSPADPATALLEEQRRYQSGGIGHFELGAQAELYPGAFGEQPFPYLGVVAAFTHSLGVVSNGVDRATGDVLAVPTDQLELFVGLRGRYRFGAARREPELHLDAGWGLFNFDLGLDALQRIEPDTVVPPMQHGYVQLGAGITYGIVPTYLTIGLDFAYRIGTQAGGDMRNVWGIDTIPSSGLLAGLELKSEIPELAPGLYVALRAQYFQFVTDFRGQVGCATADGCAGYVDPWADMRAWQVWPVRAPAAGERAQLDDVVGGPRGDVTDHYVRAQLTLGYAFQ